MAEADVLGAARHLADEVLFPAALETDRAETLPVELLDAFARSGFYGLSGPVADGGLDADYSTVCSAIEILSSGCLTTTFVWVQHVGAVRAAAASQNEAIRARVGRMCAGELRAGLALGGALPGPARLTAEEAGDGWIFRGISPFVSGWDRIDLIHTAARTEDGRLVWAFIDARETETMAVERLDLVALNATATVRAEFRDHLVPADRVASVDEYREGPPPPELLRVHASLPLGVAVRCCRLLGTTALDAELDEIRRTLDALDPETMEAARGRAGEFALRAAAALVVAQGSRSLLVEDHAQRLMREAVFALVYALRPGSRDAVLTTLGAAASG
jgi:alkylation response protein AidB-like acyl-CoA dehydrogenase